MGDLAFCYGPATLTRVGLVTEPAPTPRIEKRNGAPNVTVAVPKAAR